MYTLPLNLSLENSHRNSLTQTETCPIMTFRNTKGLLTTLPTVYRWYNAEPLSFRVTIFLLDTLKPLLTGTSVNRNPLLIDPATKPK